MLRLEHVIAGLLVVGFLIAIPAGWLLAGHPWTPLATLVIGAISSCLWLAGAITPLYDQDALPPGLLNGAAAVCALGALATTIPFAAIA